MDCQTPANTPGSNQQHTNHLIHETSPYLLQHAHNPVDWHPWGNEALEKARKENKMLIVSVGYAACHWCHVMEHESFEDSAVAELMNTHFVCIKVDREERPDIDDVYMTACHLATGGNCGWPLNAFAMPDGRPVWAGTYFPKKEWIRVLEYFVGLYQAEPDKLRSYADSLTLGISQSEHLELAVGEKVFTRSAMAEIAGKFVSNIDMKWGGRKGAPKFPMPNNYHFLMRYSELAVDEKARDAVITTLDRIADGGIYDHVGGGFARYSVDGYWHVPHFEKMLYDNGQLVSLYAMAYQWTSKQQYADVVRHTLEFIERELTDESGGFYSSLDADSEGEEGKFYVWTWEEIEEAFPDESILEVISDYYDIRKGGNWEEGKNVLRVLKPLDEVAQKHGMTEVQCHSLITEGRENLFSIRNQRIRPGLDDKILTSWNALMLKGYIDAFKALGDPNYLRIALINARFIESRLLRSDGGLNRNFKGGTSTINAFLDDYAAVIDAFIALYEVTLDEHWLNRSDELAGYVVEHFFDAESGMFYYTSDVDPPLIARKKELSDNVIPASNSILAKGLFRLGLYFDKSNFIDLAEQMLHNMLEQVTTTSSPGFYSNWCDLYLMMTWPVHEVAVVGVEAEKLANALERVFLPTAIYLGGTSEGSLPLLQNKLQEDETYIYVCRDKVCKFPVKTVEEALPLIRQYN